MSNKPTSIKGNGIVVFIICKIKVFVPSIKKTILNQLILAETLDFKAVMESLFIDQRQIILQLPHPCHIFVLIQFIDSNTFPTITDHILLHIRFRYAFHC